MVKQTVQHFGRLDVLVNNAGVAIKTPPLAEVPELLWDLTLDTNLRGVFLCTKYAVPHMIGSGGSIINVSSGAGMNPIPQSVPYGVSKAGVIQITLTTSAQYAPEGIRCNVIVPGAVDIPQSRGTRGSTEEFERNATRWGGSALPGTLPISWCSWPRRSPPTSPGPPSRSTAAAGSRTDFGLLGTPVRRG